MQSSIATSRGSRLAMLSRTHRSIIVTLAFNMLVSLHNQKQSMVLVCGFACIILVDDLLFEETCSNKTVLN